MAHKKAERRRILARLRPVSLFQGSLVRCPVNGLLLLGVRCHTHPEYLNVIYYYDTQTLYFVKKCIYIYIFYLQDTSEAVAEGQIGLEPHKL